MCSRGRLFSILRKKGLEQPFENIRFPHQGQTLALIAQYQQPISGFQTEYILRGYGNLNSAIFDHCDQSKNMFSSGRNPQSGNRTGEVDQVVQRDIKNLRQQVAFFNIGNRFSGIT